MRLFTLPRRLSFILGSFVGLLLLMGAYCGFLQMTGNIHTVIEGQLYRAAQPSGHTLETLIARHGIRTVINLRGENLESAWYREEVATAQRLGVAHVDFRMSNKKLLGPARAQELISILATAEKPILIHCQAGADRTGLVAALYMAAIAGADEETAEGQLSPYYGHIALPFTKTWAMDESFERLEPMLGYPNS